MNIEKAEKYAVGHDPLFGQMAEIGSDIPSDLAEELRVLRPLLEVQGIVQAEGRRVRLRYRAEVEGCIRHRSLALADEAIAAKVRALLRIWREERRVRVEQMKASALIKKKRALDRAQMKATVLALAGGGTHRKLRVGREFEEALSGTPSEAGDYLLGMRFMRPNPAPGRPTKFRLW